MNDIIAGDPAPTNPTAFVAMVGDRPLASADTLAAAQSEALSREAQYRSGGEYRWDEYGTDSWRLMRRSEGRPRFAWTQYWVAVVPSISKGGSR
ncbi:hypothetical protein ACFXJO_05855 [Streptomyces lavendulae]|uniref:hypothetical protein n=1 Tax=Streptomyces lavendulae TaxID=1914 RepID=UPI00369E9BAD